MAVRKVTLNVGDKSMSVKGIKVAQECYDAVFLTADALGVAYDELPIVTIVVETIYGGDGK